MMEGENGRFVSGVGPTRVCRTVDVPGVLGQYRVIVRGRALSRFIVFFLQLLWLFAEPENSERHFFFHQR